MSSPSRRGWLSPIISLTIRSEVIGDFHEPYGAIVTGGPAFFAKFLECREGDYRRKTRNCKRAQKAKAPTSPKVGAITLQSQFSQGESMNEEILKSSRVSRVAERLQSTC